jgi:hypothetical protein
LQASAGQFDGVLATDTFDALFKICPILERATLGALVDDGFRGGRADAFDRIERCRVSLVDVNLGKCKTHRGYQCGNSKHQFLDHGEYPL